MEAGPAVVEDTVEERRAEERAAGRAGPEAVKAEPAALGAQAEAEKAAQVEAARAAVAAGEPVAGVLRQRILIRTTTTTR